MKKVLVIRFSSIGDIVLTTPVVRVLKQNYADEVELHFLTKEAFKGVLRGDPKIDVIHEWRKGEGVEILSRLKQEAFDHVVDLQGNLRSLRVRMALGAPSSTFPKLNKEKWMMVNLGVDRLPRKHVVDRYFEALKPLELENDGLGAEFHIPPEEELDPTEHGVPKGEAFVTFSIGGAHATKQLPEERIVELCSRISVPVVLLGGKEDQERGARIAKKTDGSIIDRCAELSIPASASFIRQSSAVLTHDTGMMHIAAAFARPILSFWGNTVPAFGMYPYMPGFEDRSKIFEVKGLSCRPCSKLGHDACPKGHFRCMWDIDLEEALSYLNRVLEEAPPSTGTSP